jgi:hypothetical protein
LIPLRALVVRVHEHYEQIHRKSPARQPLQLRGLDQREFWDKRGISVSGTMIDVGRLKEFFGKMRDWSKSIVELHNSARREKSASGVTITI